MMMTSATAVLTEGLTLTHGDTVAVQRASLRFPTAATVAIIGPNGSGKTTLLRALAGLESPRAGTISVLGDEAGADPSRVAFVMQSTAVNAALPVTALEVVRMGRYPRTGTLGRFDANDHAAVADAMERMDVTGLANRHLAEMSGGQRQRVFVAQGLAQQADLLLLDEPITGLDLPSQARITQAVEAEVSAGRTVVMTTHDVATAASADHVLLLATHVVASGMPDEVLTKDHLAHAYGGSAFMTAGGTLVLADPHVHGTKLEGHEDH